MKITVYKSSEGEGYSITKTIKTIQEAMDYLLGKQTSNYKTIYYANNRGDRLYPDGSGQTYKYFDQITIETLNKMLKRANETCLKGSYTILRLEETIKLKNKTLKTLS